MKKKVVLLVFAMAMLLMGLGAFSACKDDPAETPTATVTISKTSLQIDRYGSAELTATADTAGKIVWSSSDEKVVVVNDGTVTAMGTGSAKVIATLEGASAKAECAVTVIPASQVPVISFDKNEVKIDEGKSLKVSAALNYRGEDVDVQFTYSVENSQIATVDKDGNVVGVSVGETKVVAQTTWRGETFKRSIDVKVQPDAYLVVKTESGEVPVDVTLRSSLPEGTDSSYIDEIKLVAQATEKGEASAAKISWSVDGDAVTVDENGLVVAQKAGEAVVRAEFKTTSGGYTIFAEVPVTVVLPDVITETVLVCERTDRSGIIDVSQIDGKVLDVQFEGVSIAQVEDGSVALRYEWVESKTDGEYEVSVLTEDVIYVANVSITTKFIEIDVVNGNAFFIVDKEESGKLWTVPGEDDAAIVGDRDDVMRYEKYNEDTDAFAYRVEMNDVQARYGGNMDYLTFDLYVVEGGSGVSIWMNYDDNKAWWYAIQVGAQLNKDHGFYIDSNGVKTDTFRSGEWMTVVMQLKGYTINRFAFMASGGVPVTYYLGDMRSYAEAKWDTPYLTNEAEVTANVEDGSHTVTLNDFELYFGNKKITEADSIVLSGGNSAVATVNGAVITFVGGGSSVFDVEITVDKMKAYTKLNLYLSQFSVNIDRSKSGVISSPEIEGTITKVLYENSVIANGADVSAWLKTVGGCSLAAVKRTVLIETDANKKYAVELIITDTRDYVDKDTFSIVNSKTLGTVWVSQDSYEGKNNVRYYKSEAGCSVWDTRVDFKNASLYEQYDYMAVEVFAASGSQVAFFLEDTSWIHVLKDGTKIEGALERAVAYMFDSEGNQMTEFKTGEWVTVVLKTSALTQNRCAFSVNNNEVAEYWVAEMSLYTQENLSKDFTFSD